MLPRGYHIRLQFLATIFANFIHITNGLTIGWFIVYGNQFHTPSTPLRVPPLEPIEVTWINASLYVGALIGTVFLTLMGDVFGRKYTLVVLIVPQMFAWLLKMFASNATELYIGRFLSGFVTGGSMNLLILFVAELADNKIRGRLGSIMPLSINIGILALFVSDIYLSFMDVASIALGVLFLFLCFYTWFPDTPRQLYKIRREEKAIESLQVYQDIQDLQCQTDDCYKIEVKTIRNTLKSGAGFNIQNCTIAVMKSLVISVALVIINVYVNWFILFELKKHQLLNTETLNLQTFRILIAICQIGGSLLCLALVDFVERKYLLLASLAGITITQILYVFGMSAEDNNWMPILLIAIAAFCLHFGVFPLTFIVVPEIIPEKIRIYGVTSVFSFMWVLMFVASQIETALVEWLPHANRLTFTVFIVFNVICSLLFMIYLPPTKRKSYEDIFGRLNNGLSLRF